MKINLEEKVIPFVTQHSRLIFLFFIVVFITIDFFVLMLPQVNTFTEIRPKINLIRSNIEAAQTQINQLPSYNQKAADLSVMIDDLRDRFLMKDDISIFLEKLSRLAMKHNISIESVLPKTIESQNLLDYNTKRFISLPVYVEADGLYHDFGRFLNALEKTPYIWRLKQFTLMSKSANQKHNIQLVMDAIVFEEIDPDEEQEESGK